MSGFTDNKKLKPKHYIYDCKIVKRLTRNTYVVDLPDGTRLYNIAVANANKVLKSGDIVTLVLPYGNLSLSSILYDKYNFYLYLKEKLFIVTEDRIYVHDPITLDGISCFYEPLLDDTIQDIAYLKDYYSEEDSIALATSPMTSNTSPSPFVADASSEVGGYEAYKCFDGSSGTYWQSTVDTSHWVSIDLGDTKNIVVVEYYLSGQSNYANDIEIQRSSDNINWVTEYSDDKIINSYPFYSYLLDFSTRYFRILVNGSADSSNTTSIGEIKLYEDTGEDLLNYRKIVQTQDNVGGQLRFEIEKGKEVVN